MDSLVAVLEEIRDGIQRMNSNIEDLVHAVNEMKGSGTFNSISDVYGKLDDVCDQLEAVSTNIKEIKGDGLFDTLADLYQKLDEISSTLDSIDINTTT